MKKLFATLAMLLSLTATAATQQATIDVSKLTEDQRAQVMQIVAQKKEEVAVKTVDNVLTRVEQFGASAARGLVGFAKEIGSEANAFAQTPLGMVVAGFTIIHFFGHEITSMVVGALFLFVVTPIATTLFIRSFKCNNYVYEYKPFLWGAWQRKVVTKVEGRYQSDLETTRTIVLGGMSLISIIVGLANFLI